MKRIVCCCLILCLTIIGLPACTTPTPTADVHAVELGDTEKQVIEKAGYPDGYVGENEDIYFYYTNEQQTQHKFLWFCEGKVSIIASMSNLQFTEWMVASSYSFESLENVEDFSFWESGMDQYDLIKQLGFGYESLEYSGFGILEATCTYALEKDCCLKVIFTAMQLDRAVIVNVDGSETVLWQQGTLKKDGTRVLGNTYPSFFRHSEYTLS